MNILVRDAKGTSKWEEPACPCKSWIEHWDYNKMVALRPSVCPVCGRRPTNMNPFVGGHVQVTAYEVANGCFLPDDDPKYYITPICNSCNAKGGFTDIKIDEDYLVSARKEDCCRYRG